MKQLYVLDWYTNKNFEIQAPDDTQVAVWEKIVYRVRDKEWADEKLSIGTYIGHFIQTDRGGIFDRILEGEEKTYFDEKQKDALGQFPNFKKSFRETFAGSIPVTGRYHIFSDSYYFYFYSEERYVFTEFVREMRRNLGKNIFLFQVGARDMIKISPETDEIIWCNGKNLCCKSSRPLPSLEVENLIIQWLEGRDIERLKGRCGKLKCSIMYEVELYVEESKRFPQKGSYVETKHVDGKWCETCGICTSYNIMTNMVTIKSSDGEIFRLSLDSIDMSKKPAATESVAKVSV